MLFAGAAAAFFAVLMTLQRSLYASAVCLLLVLLQAAVLFFLSGAPLLAFLQIMIYAGAVMVLVVVTIMAAPSTLIKGERWSELTMPRWLSVAGIVLTLIEVLVLVGRQGSLGLRAGGPAEALIGKVLFEPYAAATEAVTLLLFLSALAVLRSPENSR